MSQGAASGLRGTGGGVPCQGPQSGQDTPHTPLGITVHQSSPDRGKAESILEQPGL